MCTETHTHPPLRPPSPTPYITLRFLTHSYPAERERRENIERRREHWLTWRNSDRQPTSEEMKFFIFFPSPLQALLLCPRCDRRARLDGPYISVQITSPSWCIMITCCPLDATGDKRLPLKADRVSRKTPLFIIFHYLLLDNVSGSHLRQRRTPKRVDTSWSMGVWLTADVTADSTKGWNGVKDRGSFERKRLGRGRLHYSLGKKEHQKKIAVKLFLMSVVNARRM